MVPAPTRQAREGASVCGETCTRSTGEVLSVITSSAIVQVATCSQTITTSSSAAPGPHLRQTARLTAVQHDGEPHLLGRLAPDIRPPPPRRP
jgi:hypothetical protein